MGSRSLLRRTPFLVAWVAGVLFLLSRMEPGFWRELVGGSPAPAPQEAAAPGARSDGKPTQHPAGSGSAVPSERSAPESAGTPDTSDAATRGEEVVTAPPGHAEASAVLATPRSPEASARPARALRAERSRSVAAHALSARKAEAWRLDAEHRYAEAWAIVRELPNRPDDLDLVRLRALTALFAGQNEVALPLAETWVARDPASVEARLALLQAHLEQGDVGAAREAAFALGSRTDLDVEDWRRLAALQKWAGDPRGAAASDRAILIERPDDLAAELDLADALLSAHEPEQALAAVRRAEKLAPGSPGLTLLAARTYTSLGDRERATEEYERALAAEPGDADLELEAARYFVNAGEPQRAVDLYRRVIARRGPDGLRTELARTLLAAGDYAGAERAARAAVESAEDGPDARLALAQSVYLEGRLEDSHDLFDQAEAIGEEHGLGPVWTAQVALARDHHLTGYRLLGDRLDRYDREESADTAGPGPAPPTGSPAALELDRGMAAEKRGDYGRARSAYERAADLGARLGGGVALDRLAEKTRPLLEAGYTHFSDANGIDLDGGLVHGELWVAADSARVVAQAIAQVVSQHDTRYTRTGGSVGVRDLFVRPELSIAGDLGFVNSSAGGGDLVTADFDLRWYREDTSVVGLLGYRESLLAGHEDMDPRLFNRIINLAAVTPSFAINGGRLYLDEALRETARDRLWLSAGAENYEDGNLRGYFYGHYQLPLAQRPGLWAVVRPNAFVEAFKRSDVPDYFSPSSHATVGVAGHAIIERGRWRIEGEVDPQILITEGDPGYGAYALLDASVDLGRATVGISGFGFYDSHDDYWLARAMARVVVPF
jgi:tetratricopeptide (TPR) repeat protein